VLNEEGRQCPVDEVGEVWIGTPAGRPPRFYYGDEEASAATFDGDWVRTGDLGYIDADGFLYVVDRVKDIINRGGLKVSTVEVEEALLRHPAVQEVAVFGVTHEVLGEDVAAAVVTHAGRAATPAQLEAHCRAQLADYKVPRHIELVDELPRNALGKVLKRELRAGFEARRVAAGGSAATAAVSE